MLTGGLGRAEGMKEMKAMQECKPNYEEMIERSKEQLRVTMDLLSSAKSFLRDGPPFELTRTREGGTPFIEMIGALHLAVAYLDREIDRYIALLENEQE